MTGELFYDVNHWLMGCAGLALFLLATEIGFRCGFRLRATMSDQARSQVSSIQAAVLGLLALLLGFTFAMSMSRFDSRKQLVLEEANAIGTTALRARLLPEPHRHEVADLLRRYVDVRLAFYEAGIDQEKLRAATTGTEKLQGMLWAHAVALGGQDTRAVMWGMFIQSLNEVIDLHTKRVTALANHVPESVILLLFFVSVMACGLTGYCCGLGGQRHSAVTAIKALLITAVIFLIIDLDRPRRGLIQVSQQAMITLKESMKAAR